MKEKVMVIQKFSVQNFLCNFLYINGTKLRMLKHQINNKKYLHSHEAKPIKIHISIYVHPLVLQKPCICDHL